MAAHQEDFSFQIFKKLHSFEDGSLKDFLVKWNLDERMRIKCFSFDKTLRGYQYRSFCESFFNDPSVTANVEVTSKSGKWCPLNLTGSKAVSVDVEEVPCTLLSMDFFDRLFSEGVVRQSGSICKCLEEYLDDLCVADELRKVLLVEGSDHYSCYSEEERRQLLFRMFKHICLGGPICQYEDEIGPYLDTCKRLYKDIVSVVKDADTEKLSITSLVYKVTVRVEGKIGFPGSCLHEQNFCYLIVDPHNRHVTCWYCIWS